jgi:anti-anti-sigma regulatory factor
MSLRRGWESTREVRLRIDRIDEPGIVTIRVAGWLEAAGTEELQRVCKGPPPQLQLDLSELRAADASGLDALLGLQRAGAVLTGVPPYIELLLNARRRAGRDEPEGRSSSS